MVRTCRGGVQTRLYGRSPRQWSGPPFPSEQGGQGEWNPALRPRYIGGEERLLPQIPSCSLRFRIGREIILCRGRADTGAFALRPVLRGGGAAAAEGGRGYGPRRGGRPYGRQFWGKGRVVRRAGPGGRMGRAGIGGRHDVHGRGRAGGGRALARRGSRASRRAGLRTNRRWSAGQAPG